MISWHPLCQPLHRPPGVRRKNFVPPRRPHAARGCPQAERDAGLAAGLIGPARAPFTTSVPMTPASAAVYPTVKLGPGRLCRHGSHHDVLASWLAPSRHRGHRGPGLSDLASHPHRRCFHDRGDLSVVVTEISPGSWKRGPRASGRPSCGAGWRGLACGRWPVGLAYIVRQREDHWHLRIGGAG